MRLGLTLLLVLPSLAPAAERIDFRTHIYPLLHDRCFRCHQGDDASSGIRLDRPDAVRKYVTPGQGDASRLIRLVRGDNPKRVMPPKGERLSGQQVHLLRDWIDQGLAWDEELLPTDAANHWAFRPVRRPPVPVVKNAGWVRSPVDAFIAARHEAAGVSPAPAADRRTLLRRLALDLTGLPPTPGEIDQFVNDPRPGAYDRQVERLLASPAYGERWARHWLDVARYADSEGYESDHVRPYAWRYRDWVIRALNSDLPYDQFVRQQLAGDELTPYRDDHLIATGFLAAARLSSNEEDRARQLNDVYVDVVNATAQAFLGLTMGCAQCHSHKFDPLPHRDYYRLQGFFLTGMPNNLALRDPAGWAAREKAKPPEYEPARQLLQALFAPARAKLTAEAYRALSPEHRAAYDTPSDRRTTEQHRLAVEAALTFQFTHAQVEKAIPAADRALYTEVKKKVAALEAKVPGVPQTWGFYSPVTSPHPVAVLPMVGFYPPAFDPAELARAKPFVLAAGDAKERRDPLAPGWPGIFGPTPAGTRTRTALADWLTRPEHPLTARVWVNRLWQYHFGRGIVSTPGDFGVRGARPSHPELLDWLAAELVASGWSTKHVHRLMITSSTYRQAAGEPAAADPENHRLTRWAPRRVAAEVGHDAMLFVSGQLQSTVGGPPDADEVKSRRRAVYLLLKRQKPPAGLTLFDGPTAATESCPKRTVSNTPLHALFLMNNDLPVALGRAFAERVTREVGNDRAKQIDRAFRLALGRLPTTAERTAVTAYLEKTAGDADALAELCHALLAANEFTTLE